MTMKDPDPLIGGTVSSIRIIYGSGHPLPPPHVNRISSSL